MSMGLASVLSWSGLETYGQLSTLSGTPSQSAGHIVAVGV